MKGVEAGNELRGIDLPTTAAAVVDAVEHVAVAVGFALALAGVHQVDHARARPRDVRREEKGIHASVGRREHRLSGAFGKAAGCREARIPDQEVCITDFQTRSSVSLRCKDVSVSV